MRGARELAVTVMGFASIVYSMIWAIEIELFPLYALLILPAAGFLVRLFMIQHDCAHRSFFPSRCANDCVGRLIGIATLTPHDHWRASHAFHHASSGDLDRRGIGDVLTLTVAEYLALSPWGRLRYRLYRHPAVMFGIGPSFLFLLFNRLPLGFIKKGWRPWLSTMATNFGIVAMLVMLIATIGLRPFLWIYPPTVLVAAAAGVWLFYVQHQFEGTYWARGADVERPRRCAVRKLALPPAHRCPLVHGQHRNAQRASSLEPDPVLSSARGSERPPGAWGRRARDSPSESQGRSPRALGRRATATGVAGAIAFSELRRLESNHRLARCCCSRRSVAGRNPGRRRLIRAHCAQPALAGASPPKEHT